ncbi:acyl-CoA dehydrogenase family protein [soil metagenome]
MSDAINLATKTAGEAGEVVARVRALKPLLAANAVQGEKDRRAVQESVEALQAAGAFRVGVPRRWGGYETSVRNQLEVSSAVAEADGGLAWVTTLTNVGCWIVGLQNEELQHDIFGDGPDARTVGIIGPSVKARPVEGGYRVNGKGFYASGSMHAQWAGNGALLLDEAGEVVGQAMVFAPMSELSIEDTWFVVGMRASGSNCIVWDDVFVPYHRVFDVGPANAVNEYQTPYKDEVLYRSVFSSTLAVVLTGPQLGLARAALEFVLQQAQTKGIAYTIFGKQKDSVAFQLRVAQAATRIHTAELNAYDAADAIDAWAAEGHVPSLLERARIRAQVATTVENINTALNDLLFAHGSGGFAESSPLQRFWRDSNVAARHAFVLPDVSYESYGKTLLGVDEQIAPVL